MKKFLSLLSALLLIFVLSSSAFAEYVKTAASDGSLNVRSGPGKSYSVTGWVKNGAKIKVLSKGTNWSRIKVTATGKTGYIKNKYIVKSDPSPKEPVNKKVLTVKTKYAGSTVNLRKKATTDSGVVAELKRGTRLYVLDTAGNWYHVKTASGKTGYIYKTYVSKGADAEITANGVRLRKGPSTSYSVIRKMKRGTDITVLIQGKSWSKVKVNGKTGYVSNSYYEY